MDRSIDKLEEFGEAIQLASQEDFDLAAVKEDVNMKKLEDLLHQFQIQKRLILEGDVRKRKIFHLQENENIPEGPQEFTDKIMKESGKSEEELQKHLICEKALEVCQFSIALKSTFEQNDQYAKFRYFNFIINNIINFSHALNRITKKNDEELVKSSIEYVNISKANISESHNLERLENELEEVQSDIKKVQLDIAEMKLNPEATPGTTSERIERYVVLFSYTKVNVSSLTIDCFFSD